MRKTLPFILLMVAIYLTGCGGHKRIDASRIPVNYKKPEHTAGSLWPGETSQNTLFSDFSARNVGDTLTIVVSERTSATKEAVTSTSRESSTDVGINRFLGMPTRFGMNNFLNQGNPFSPDVEEEYKAEFDGSGKTRRVGTLEATITVRVVDVLPNGNLIVEGRKETVVNKEQQYFVLTGIVRPVDISPDNTILSTQVSDLRVEYTGRGVISDEQGPGWMRRILDNVWPF